MSSVYSLYIKQIRKRTDTGAIDKIVWVKVGLSLDGGVSATYEAETSYKDIDSSSSSFVPFDNLTEDMVENWVKNDPQYQSCDGVIEDRIHEKRINRVELSPDHFPWANQANP